ncbi:MAG: peptide-methionine (R)-S-oxide reductase, partial [Candidatus Saccharimonadales bacterium]
MDMTDDDWKQKLTPEQYHVLREKGTEIPGTGKYVHFHEDGMYH